MRLALFLSLLTLAACSSSEPEDDGLNVTGTYDGSVSTPTTNAEARLVARETSAGTVTGTFTLGSGTEAFPYGVSGQRDGTSVPLVFQADAISFRITYEATVTQDEDGRLILTGTARGGPLGTGGTRLRLTQLP